MKKVVTRNSDLEDIELKDISKAEETKGKLSRQDEENKLMHSVLENDENTVKDGKLLSDAINQGFNSFTPDMMFDNLAKDFATARNLYGEKLIRLLSSYNPNYIKRNIHIPEFKRELKKAIQDKVDELKKKKLIKRDGTITDSGIKLASLVLYTEELDHIMPKGIFGEKIHKKSFLYGERDQFHPYKKGDRYADLAIKKSVKMAIRRNHTTLETEDLMISERQSKGSVNIVYGLDASGSMKGDKIEMAKKAGIALAYKAISSKDNVGLIVFGSKIKEKVHPTTDFKLILEKITKVRAAKETNMTETIKQAIEIFPPEDVTKHLILITDALPTIGKEPEQETLEAVSLAISAGITISLVGINLDKKGKLLAERLTQLGNGRLYTVRNLEEMDKIVLEDYYSTI